MREKFGPAAGAAPSTLRTYTPPPASLPPGHREGWREGRRDGEEGWREGGREGGGRAPPLTPGSPGGGARSGGARGRGEGGRPAFL